MDDDAEGTATEGDGEGARPRRYTLSELLEGADALPELYAGTEGCLDGPPVGREVA